MQHFMQIDSKEKGGPFDRPNIEGSGSCGPVFVFIVEPIDPLGHNVDGG